MFFLVLIIKVLFEAFNDANTPVRPFRLSFSGGPIEREVFLNEKTNEELVMCSADFGAEPGMKVIIQRSAKEKKNSHKTE